jgi:hypothetical protein
VLFADDRAPVKPRLAAVRSYTVRTLRDVDGVAPQNRFFTETMLSDVVMRRHWPYDPLEPDQTSDLDPVALGRYPLVLAELGSLSKAALAPFPASDAPCVLFIEGADRFEIDGDSTRIARFVRPLRATPSK